MTKTKTSRFPGRIEKRRRVALENLEKRVGPYSAEIAAAQDNGEADTINPKRIAENRLQRTQEEIAVLKKHLRINT